MLDTDDLFILWSFQEADKALRLFSNKIKLSIWLTQRSLCSRKDVLLVHCNAPSEETPFSTVTQAGPEQVSVPVNPHIWLKLSGSPQSISLQTTRFDKMSRTLGIPWQFEKWKQFDESHQLGYTYKKGKIVFVSERQFPLIFWFSILRQYIPRTYTKLMVTHVVW